MLLKTEDGGAINLAHVTLLQIGQTDENELRFFIVALPSNTIVARFATREESQKYLNLIVSKSGGMTRDPNAPVAATPRSSQSYSF